MRTFATVTLGLVLLSSGLAHAQGVALPLPPEDQQNITAQLGPGVVGIALPSQPIADPSLYFPPGRLAFHSPSVCTFPAWGPGGRAGGRLGGFL